jgi:hypothetical protein
LPLSDQLSKPCSVQTHLRRAKQALDVRSLRVYDDGRPVSYWLLPGQEFPTGQSEPDAMERLLAKLRRQFPHRGRQSRPLSLASLRGLNLDLLDPAHPLLPLVGHRLALLLTVLRAACT